jgi:transposase
MRSSNLPQVFVPLQFDVFSGLDVDKLSISATFYNHNGFIRSIRIPYKSDNILNYVKKHFVGQKVAFAYESGPTGYGLYDDITKAGYYCMVACAARIPQVPGQNIKTNRRDSKKIAESLRGGQLNNIHVPTIEYRNLRHLVQLRDIYVKQIKANKSRINMLLLYEGIEFPAPEHTSPWTHKILTELEQLQCRETVRFKLNALISNITYNKELLLVTMKQIRKYCKENNEIDSNVKLLKTIPGIGYSTAVELIARIGDWRLLTNVRQIASFIGLVPKENSTGNTIRRGSITRAGSSRTRNKLIQCAWAAIRKDPELNEFYKKVYASHCQNYAAKKAIVAVARKLTTRVFAVLTEQRPYVMKDVSICQNITNNETQPSQGTTRIVIEPETIN